MKDIIVGVDRSETALRAVESAVDLAQARLFLDDVVRRLSCDSTTRAVGVGDPAKMMCEEAERLDARTIVVGNRRVQGVGRVLGSVASNVAKWAPCDVLVANTSVGA